jgi:hypothetical protein
MELTPSSQPLCPRLIYGLTCRSAALSSVLNPHNFQSVTTLSPALSTLSQAIESVEGSIGLISVALLQRSNDLANDGLGEEWGHGIPNLLAHKLPSKPVV